MSYDHLAVEPRWQEYWSAHRTFQASRRPGRPKLYVLDMFPYPSGSGLHVGHPEGYTATDIIARYQRMRGFDVLHPMGWDAFGLPAEQHAITTGTHPAVTTRENIAVFKRQLMMLGFAYDWSREVNTTDPGYFKWTQWIFLKLFERGLAFQAEIPVNWCPELGTVLANEEVIDGRSERGGFPVVRQPLRQWQLRITAYADRLEQDLDSLDWPETKQKQRDWIGRSEGAEVDFPLVGRDDALRVFTTRPDTLYGATYMVIAPDHPLTLEITAPAERARVEAYAEAAQRKSDMERTALNKAKTGVYTGAHARNPLSGANLPIYTADYVLGAYGTGAIMAVPAHDERDFEFARQFDIPIIEVVSPDGALHDRLEAPFTGDGVAVRSGLFDGQRTPEMKQNVIDYLEERGIGRRRVNTKLRDWVFSRQRYWGEPIPIYFPVETSGDPRRGDPYTIDYASPIPVDERELPLLLPELEDYQPGDPAGPLARARDWRFFEKEGKWYARETNTMPQWAGSCWYYLRYLDPHNDERIFSEQAYDDWMPVDLYMGGSEHAVLHLLYARFWHKVLYDLGVVKHPEPFTKLVHQGMILGMVYRYYAVDGGGALDGDDPRVVHDREAGTYTFEGRAVEPCFVLEADVATREGVPVHREHGVKLAPLAEKMSKSRGNVVNPDDVVREFGADSLRVYEMFMGPLEQVKPWQTSGLQGVRRFLDRVHKVATGPLADGPMDDETDKLVHRTVKKVGEDIEALRFNTAVSAMMILVNRLGGLDRAPRAAVERLVLCLSPFAPHLAEELWAGLGHPPSIADVEWPSFDLARCEDDVVELAVQVNGKVRGRVRLAKDAAEGAAREAALADAAVAKAVDGRAVKQLVYVPGRIINLIVG
ncbi:MAG: leucine--tRNA ligase [Sorangiineae bacterium]|nr:leucine--tRNA ligase [Polyangiaceae bacterium]MEB2324163.1 leucine--tRNA ligase [Sorangiineae bacterium]